MGFARTYSVALVGLHGHIVDVEADVSQGLPGFVLLGLPDTALNESKSVFALPLRTRVFR